MCFSNLLQTFVYQFQNILQNSNLLDFDDGGEECKEKKIIEYFLKLNNHKIF